MPRQLFASVDVGLISVEDYIQQQRLALQEYEKLRLQSKPRRSGYRDSYNHKLFAGLACEVFIFSRILKVIGKEQDMFFLNPWTGTHSFQRFISVRISETAPKIKIITAGVAPAISKLNEFQIFFFDFVMLLRALTRKHRNLDLNPLVLVDNVEPAFASLDADGGTSMAFLSNALSCGYPRTLVYQMRVACLRSKWEEAGYPVVECWSELLSIGDRLKVLFEFFRSDLDFIPRNSYAMRHTARFLIMKRLTCRKAVSHFIYTNSVGRFEPVEAVACSESGGTSIMLNYSCSLWEGSHWAYMIADKVYVWNQLMANFINSHPQNKRPRLINSGPTVFSSLLAAEKNKKAVGASAQLSIAVFDVTPKRPEVIINAGLSTPYNFDYWLNFLGDICSLQVLNSVGRITLYVKNDSPDVRAYLTNYLGEKVHLAKTDRNLYTEISRSDLCISMPFTSPFYIARYLRIPSIFYSPTNGFFGSSEVLYQYLVVGRDRLHEELRNKAYIEFCGRENGLLDVNSGQPEVIMSTLFE